MINAKLGTPNAERVYFLRHAFRRFSDAQVVIEAALPASAKVAITGIASLRALLQKDE